MIALPFDLLSFPFPAFPTKPIGPTHISFHCCWLFSPGATSSPQLQYFSCAPRISGSYRAFIWACFGYRDVLTKQGHWDREGPLLIPKPSLGCSRASCSQGDGGAQWTGNKSILRDPVTGPELITCQLYALRLCVLCTRLGGRNEALVGLLSTAFAQGNSGKWFSSHTGVFFNYALSGTRAELNNPHCSLCVFPVVQGRMRWVTGEGCYLAEVLPGGPETGPLLTCTPET